MKKYEFTGEKKKILVDTWVHRIRALRDFDDVKAGDLGGWIENEHNLTHYGSAWAYDDSIIADHGIVCFCGKVREHARVYDYSVVSGCGEVSGSSVLLDKSGVCDQAIVHGNVILSGNVKVSGKSMVCGDFELSGTICLSGQANITKKNDVLSLGPIGSRNDITTFYRDKQGGISVSCGCFDGTLDEFLKQVDDVHGKSKHGYTYQLAARLAKLQIMG